MRITTLAFCALIFPFVADAKDCGIAPSGYSFGPNCEIYRASASKKDSPAASNTAPEDKTRWEEVRFSMKSGKPGYMAAVGADYKLELDAILMNETVTDDIDRVFVRAALGSYRTCQVNGLQQSIGYTVFKVRNCR
ncbi:MAG: hypothetical protein EOP09_11365 [Proteobacteria bacterium]|nr:MAG: hypothetical protein EOP09_11365 [Pseudomonadota bacterium]